MKTINNIATIFIIMYVFYGSLIELHYIQESINVLSIIRYTLYGTIIFSFLYFAKAIYNIKVKGSNFLIRKIYKNTNVDILNYLCYGLAMLYANVVSDYNILLIAVFFLVKDIFFEKLAFRIYTAHGVIKSREIFFYNNIRYNR
jgi:hypothetical protein